MSTVTVIEWSIWSYTWLELIVGRPVTITMLISVHNRHRRLLAVVDGRKTNSIIDNRALLLGHVTMPWFLGYGVNVFLNYWSRNKMIQSIGPSLQCQYLIVNESKFTRCHNRLDLFAHFPKTFSLSLLVFWCFAQPHQLPSLAPTRRV